MKVEEKLNQVKMSVFLQHMQLSLDELKQEIYGDYISGKGSSLFDREEKVLLSELETLMYAAADIWTQQKYREEWHFGNKMT